MKKTSLGKTSSVSQKLSKKWNMIKSIEVSNGAKSMNKIELKKPSQSTSVYWIFDSGVAFGPKSWNGYPRNFLVLTGNVKSRVL